MTPQAVDVVDSPRHAPYLCVYASQAAACIGENRHKKISDAVETVWERADAVGYRAARRRNGILTDDEILAKAETAYVEVADMLKAATTRAESSTEVASKYSTLSTKFQQFATENKLGEDERRVIDDALRKTSYTSYGNEQESNVFRYLRDTLGIDCVEDPTFYKVQAGVVDTPHGSFPWFIGGKIDAISSDRSLLIEIKNRVNRLFRRPPTYEMVQVQTYLWLLNIDKGLLVECMKTGDRGSVPHEDVNLIPVARDKVQWTNDYFPRLRGFIDFVAHLVHDESLQDKFLKSKRRSALVTSHVSRKLGKEDAVTRPAPCTGTSRPASRCAPACPASG